MRLAKKR